MRRSIALAEYICVYCGQIGDTIDHVPPTSARNKLRWLGLLHTVEQVEVRACRECNSALSDQGYWTVRERKRYIKGWLQRRYARFLNIPEWTPDELLELGRGLQDMVVGGIHMQNRIIRRLKF
jgi:5-methylcytosine-specific restriction endonuclease McrA